MRRTIPGVASATVVYGGDSPSGLRDIPFIPFHALASRLRDLGLA